jgi:hypothetical protein
MDAQSGVEPRITRHIVAVEALPRLEVMVREHNRRVDKLAKRHHIEIARAISRTLRTFQGQRIPADIGSGGWKFVPPADATDPRAVRYWAEVEVSGQRAMISGWEIVASLTLTDAGHLLSIVSGSASEYAAYRDKGGSCEHCKTSRQRTVTYLLRKGDEIKLVGSKCLKDFTGHMSPSAWASYADSLVGFEREISNLEDEDDEGSGKGRRIAEAVAIPQYLAFVAMEIRLHGWLSKSKAWASGGTPTAATAWEIMLRHPDELAEEDRRKSHDDLELVTDTLSVKENREDYEEHLMVVINQGYAFFRNIGLVASICAAADRIRRDTAQAAARKREVSEWFGEVGKREVFTLKVVHTQPFDGHFGLSYLHIFIDGRGRKSKWFSSGECLEKATYEIKATVKKHEVYEGRKETLLSRCTVVRKCDGDQPVQPEQLSL